MSSQAKSRVFPTKPIVKMETSFMKMNLSAKTGAGALVLGCLIGWSAMRTTSPSSGT